VSSDAVCPTRFRALRRPSRRGSGRRRRAIACLAGRFAYELETFCNFLVEAPHRAWRLQLARTFPPFLRAAATCTPALRSR
jgi:hypothetical protein